MNIAFILLVVLTVARLWIGLQLFLTARKNHLNNLYWLVGVFLLAAYSLFSPLPNGSPLENPWIFNIGFIAGQFCLTIFIHTTFYRDRKSPVVIILGLFVITLFVDLYLLSINETKLATVVAGVSLVNWIWHLIVAGTAYRSIAQDQGVEKWIKVRYKLMIFYIVLIIISSIQSVIVSTSLAFLIPPQLVPLSILLVLGSIALQFLVWVMPEGFRLWLNRDQKARPANEEQHPFSVLDVFGTAMTDGTGLNTIVCFYAIRSAIGQKIGSQDSAKIQQQINTMSYQDWDAVLEQAELHRILINGGANQAAAGRAIENAQQALIEKQSLFTLSTH